MIKIAANSEGTWMIIRTTFLFAFMTHIKQFEKKYLWLEFSSF